MLVVCKLPNLNFQRSNVEKTNTQLSSVLFYGEDVLGLISLLLTLESTLGYHVADLAIDYFVRFGQVLNAIFFLDFEPSFKLPWIFSLLDHCDLEAVVHHFLQVFVEHFFWKTDV